MSEKNKKAEKFSLRAQILENPDFENPEKWKSSQFFFCVKCDSPALINQMDRRIWGCRKCNRIKMVLLGEAFYQKNLSSENEV